MLDLDLEVDLKAHRWPRGSTVVFPTTLHIGCPCHMDAPPGWGRFPNMTTVIPPPPRCCGMQMLNAKQGGGRKNNSWEWHTALFLQATPGRGEGI